MKSCRCGQPGTNELYLHYRRPRPEFEPLAVDQWNIHGSWPLTSCGSAACEAEEYAELLTVHPDAVVSVDTEPGHRFFADDLLGDEDDAS